jgi:hypothetical protein
MNWEIGGIRPLRKEISVEINGFPIKYQFAKTPNSSSEKVDSVRVKDIPESQQIVPEVKTIAS